MPWNFRIFRGNASGENVGAVPKAQLLLSSELSQTPVFIGFPDTMSGVQNFHAMEKVFHAVEKMRRFFPRRGKSFPRYGQLFPWRGKSRETFSMAWKTPNMNRNCPLCNVPLEKEDYEGFPVLYCPDCQGHLVDPELEDAIAKMPLERDPFSQGLNESLAEALLHFFWLRRPPRL
jgi:hypothetical protein